MARTFISPIQITVSEQYDDTLAAGSGLESISGGDLQSDLNAIRSMIKNMSGEAHWYDALSGRDLKTADEALVSIETKKFLFRRQNINTLTIPAGANYVQLEGSAIPSQDAAVGGTSNGVVVAELGMGEFGSHSLAEVAGSSANKPKNLVMLRQSDSHDVLTSSMMPGQTIYGLFQVENGFVDGDAITESAGARAQLSLVYEDENGDLVAADVSDVEGRTVNFSYVVRDVFEALPEDATLAGDVFVDVPETFLMSDITLDRALDNQGSAPTTTDSDIVVNVALGHKWTFQGDGSNLVEIDSAGSVTLTGAAASFNSNTNNFANSAIIDNDGTAVTVGAGSVSTAGSSDLTVSAASNLYFKDQNDATGIKLSTDATTWSDWSTNFGAGASLMEGINTSHENLTNDLNDAIANALTRKRFNQGLGSAAAADSDVTITGLDLTGHDLSTEVEVYINGVLARPGSDNTADVYAGTGVDQLKFALALAAGTQIVVIVYENSQA